MLVCKSVNNLGCPLPLQDMQRLAKGLKDQLNESSEIANKKRVENKIELQLQQTQRETSRVEKLLEEELEVGPTVHPLQICHQKEMF